MNRFRMVIVFVLGVVVGSAPMVYSWAVRGKPPTEVFDNRTPAEMILGEWTATDETGTKNPSAWTFSKDGRVVTSTPIFSAAGEYQIEERTMTLKLGGTTYTCKMEFDGPNRVKIHPVGPSIYRLVRIK